MKINLLDTPGYSTFINETKASLIAADAALIVVDAAAGVQVVTEKVWDYATEYDQPRAFVLNWMDRELASFERAMESLQHVFGRGVVPLQMPIGARKRISRRGRSGHDEGADVHAGWRRQGEDRGDSRECWRTMRKRRTRRWWKWSPRATTR